MNWRQRVLVGTGLALLTGLLGLALGRVPFMHGVEWKLYDLRMRQTVDPANAPRNIVIVEIDEDSLRDLEPLVGRWPWPRMLHARLIDYLARAPARLIVYDVLFLEHDRQQSITIGGVQTTGAESDDELVNATARAGNVIYLGEASIAGDAPEDADDQKAGGFAYRLNEALDERPRVTPPFKELAAVSLGIGHNRAVLDDDGPLRRVVPFLRPVPAAAAASGAAGSAGAANGGANAATNGPRTVTPPPDVPSLGVAAFLAASKIGPERVRVDSNAATLMLGTRELALLRFPVPKFESDTGPREARHALIRFRGQSVLEDGKTTYRSYPFADLLLSEEQIGEGQTPRVDPAVFKDAIVFVGVSAAALHDTFMTPLGNTGKTPGTQIHATVTDQLMAGRTIRPVAALPHAVVVFAGAWIVSVLILLLPMRYDAIGAGLPAVGVTWLGFWLFGRGWWLSLIEPYIAIGFATTGGLAWQYFVEGREKRQVKRLFSRYLSKDVYEEVLKNPALAELGGSRRTMSVLFSDMRGFTALSERGQPEALVTQLNEYFTRMVEIVFEHRGTLDKFVGDMVMALFGAPLDDESHADHAVQTALAMAKGLEVLNVKWAAEGRPTLGIGIGVNTGEMIAGTIGAETVRSYTVIGDAVNLGARLESLNKDYGTQIIVSEFTVNSLKDKTRYHLRPLGQVTVKGKSVPVEIFEVLATNTGTTGDRVS
jgi:adenylate cyclase